MIAILDYKAGNLTSVERALRHLGFPCRITDQPDEIRGAERIIFPGVGAAGQSMRNLRDLGLDRVLSERYDEGVPILGICVGLQVLFHYSEENETPCLDLIPGKVRLFRTSEMGGEHYKIPHMGWNEVQFVRPHPVFEGIPAGSEFYFVHSYFAAPSDPDMIVGKASYGIEFAAAVATRNLVAVQFHAEKSGPPGLRILENFCRWNGSVRAAEESPC